MGYPKEMNTGGDVDCEGLQSKFLKFGVDFLVFSFLDLFNIVVCLGFPPLSKHIIHPILKPGDNFYRNNYKTLIIRHTFAKLYVTVLDISLLGYFKRDKLEVEGQVGCRHSYQKQLWISKDKNMYLNKLVRP